MTTAVTSPVTGGDALVVVGAAVPDWVRRCVPADVVVAPTPDHPATPDRPEIVEAALRAARSGRPVLVPSTPSGLATDRPPRVVVAVQRMPEDLPAVLAGSDWATALGGELELLHAVPVSFGERSVGLEAATRRGWAVLVSAGRAVASHAAGAAPVCRLVHVHPHELVDSAPDADLLVVGGTRPGSAALGLVAHSVLHHAPCAVLVVGRGARREPA